MPFWDKWFGRRAVAAESGSAAPPPTRSVATIVEGPGATCGFFERAYDAASGTVELRYAFREDLPAWIDGVTVPLVPGKGIPTVTYATLRAMRQLGIKEGQARAFVLRCVHEVESITHLDWLIRRYPETPVGELARQTHSFQYAETAIVQSGHKVVAVQVATGAAERRPIGDLLTHYERMSKEPTAAVAAHDAILAKYGCTRASEVLLGYDLRIMVAPWK